MLHCTVSTKSFHNHQDLCSDYADCFTVFYLYPCFIQHSQLFVTYVIVSYTGLFTSSFDEANMLGFSPGVIELYFINMYP
jgi:hypothetical protein